MCVQGEDGDYYYILDSGHTEVWLAKPPGEPRLHAAPTRQRTLANIPTLRLRSPLLTCCVERRDPRSAVDSTCSGFRSQATLALGAWGYPGGSHADAGER